MIRLAVLSVLVVVALAATSLAGDSSDASGGVLDQHLEPEPPTCHDVGITVSGGTKRQEFVPSKNQLLSIDLCVQAADDLPIEINIRQGSANVPGEILSTGTGIAGEPAYQWVHIPLDTSPLSVTPGTTYVIEAPDTDFFAIVGTCRIVMQTYCMVADDDLYPPGVADAVSTSIGIGDFGFRTYGEDGPTPTQTASPAPTESPEPTESSSPTETPSPTPTASASPTESQTPTASPFVQLWADLDCSGAVDLADAEYLLTGLATLKPPPPDGCPQLFMDVLVDAVTREWGDINCTQPQSVIDVLAMFLHLAGLPFDKGVDCPEPGDVVQLG